ncbi:hypothetical protein SAMN05421541_106264 [Actinoplanes philippinensis]|uniref:Uncharacterized protein n=1 Tax=Actinoplanes philippinensis TaxID=35752 RepID=A0A1I2G919_9ACTN|nr:hypothetical protein SAMN05421541_106264 [Actinoplanes philippinensis]
MPRLFSRSPSRSRLTPCRGSLVLPSERGVRSQGVRYSAGAAGNAVPAEAGCRACGQHRTYQQGGRCPSRGWGCRARRRGRKRRPVAEPAANVAPASRAAAALRGDGAAGRAGGGGSGGRLPRLRPTSHLPAGRPLPFAGRGCRPRRRGRNRNRGRRQRRVGGDTMPGSAGGAGGRRTIATPAEPGCRIGRHLLEVLPQPVAHVELPVAPLAHQVAEVDAAAPVLPAGDGDDPAGAALLQGGQQRPGQREVAEVVDTDLALLVRTSRPTALPADRPARLLKSKCSPP